MLDKELRKREILKKLGKGKSREEIAKDLKKEFGVCDATINKDFRDALEHLQSKQEIFLRHISEVIMERYELLWVQAREAGDYKAATQILKQMCDAFGLNVKRTEVTVKDSDFTIHFE
jgi:adenylyl- and sulfurtransferase ThiI